MHQFRFLILVLLLFLVGGHAATAGRLYARKPGTASPVYNLVQTEVHTRTSIRNIFAVTHVDETFHNNTDIRLEGFYAFALPEGAVVDGLWMWLDGQRYTFIVKRKEEAQQMYDSLQEEQTGDPVILESLGANRFQIRVSPIPPHAQRRIELRYFQVLPVNPEGIVRYDYPMNNAGYQGSGVQTLDLQVDLEMDAPFDLLETNFDQNPLILGRTPYSDRRIVLHLDAESILLEKDFTVHYRLAGWADSLFVLHHRDSLAADSSTFLLWFPDTIDASEFVKGDFLFMIDASGSMTGLRKAMVEYAMGRVLSRLLPFDRFGIVLFNDEIRRFPPDTSLLPVTEATRQAAGDFLQQHFRPVGTTNYEAALALLGDVAFREEAHRRCVFVTDGLPNEGARNTNDLLPYLSRENRLVSFYPLSIYTGNIEMLSDLARLTMGKLTALEQGMNIDDALERMTFDFTGSTVQQAMLEYPPQVLDGFPEHAVREILPARMSGAGRYATPMHAPCTFSYALPGITQRIRSTRMLTLDDAPGEAVQVSRYWASLRIRQLLDQLRDVTDSTEIREAVIRLSEKYMILTPFTAFIVYREDDDPVELSTGVLAVAEELQLRQNYPNPFNPTTSISFYLPHHAAGARAALRIYDLKGRLVRVLRDGIDIPGWHTVLWDGRDDAQRALPSGSYFCVLTYGRAQRMITMTLLK